jgi:MFS family permease
VTTIHDKRGWFIVLAAILVLGGSVNLQMPLYAQYAQGADFGFTGLTLLFAAYILGLVPTLALAGGASDAVGRRPVVLAAIIAAALATVAMIVSVNVYTLLVARVFHGVAVALGLGSATAWLTERLVDPARASWWSSITTALAFGIGGLVTTLSLNVSGGGLTPWSYHLGLFALLLVGVLMLRVPGGNGGNGGAWLRLPTFPRGTRLFTLGNMTSWSVSGTLLALGPATFAQAGWSTGAGVGVFVLCGTGALVQLIPMLRFSNPRRGMVIGACSSTLALALFDLGIRLKNPWLLLAGCACAGAAGFGFMYLAGLTAVNAAAGDRRAAAVSGYLLVSYVGFGCPCLLVGWLCDVVGAETALAWGVGVVASAFMIILLAIRTRTVLCKGQPQANAEGIGEIQSAVQGHADDQSDSEAPPEPTDHQRNDGRDDADHHDHRQ